MRKFLLRIVGRRAIRSAVPVAAVGIAALSLLMIGGAEGAMVRVGRIVIRADGGFTPRKLPRRAYAPINFRGHADISSTDAGPVPALQQARLEFDRDGRLSTRGLPTCAPSRLANTNTDEARRRCGEAIVGTGHIDAVITIPGRSPVPVSSPLSIFNGPPSGGHPTAVAHAHIDSPFPETYVVVIPIEPLQGSYSYRATLDVPEISGGYGAITHIDAKIGRRYQARGSTHSYTSARCRDGIFETRGAFLFEDGTLIEGSVAKPCTALPQPRRARR